MKGRSSLLVRFTPGGLQEHREVIGDALSNMEVDAKTADVLFICRS